MKLLAAAATLLAGLVTAPVLALAILVPMMAGGMQAQQHHSPAAAACNNWADGLPARRGLTARQFERAASIYGTALDLGLGPHAAVVGIATALQESSLGSDPRSRRPDADSNIGLFQQRVLPGWHADGTTIAENIQILLDDHYQTQVFFHGHTTTNGWHIPGLADIPDWRHLPVTQAAQQVQVSAFPDAYAKHETVARALVIALATNPDTAGAVPCGAQDPSLTFPAIPAPMGTEVGQTPDAIRVMRCVAAKWPQIRTIGGLRPGDPRDHGTGRAVDVMIPNWHTPTGHGLGSEIASWAQTNATSLGVTYVIWDRKIWSVAHASKGWRDCSEGSCYAGADSTAAHLDHVHISVAGKQGTHTFTREQTVALPLEKGTYRLTARYGQSGNLWSTVHTGLDFAAPAGTPIHAVIAGEVTYARNSHGPYGNLTKIQAVDGTETWYAHQTSITVTAGQHVTAGQPIGTIGTTGNAQGAHLHLEVRTAGRPTDPLAWLRKQGLNP